VIRVLLADDQPLIRTGFRMILDAEPDIEVVGEAGDGADAVRQAVRLRPGGRPGGGGLPVGAERAAAAGQVAAAGEDEAAFPGPQDLAVLEAEAPHIPERAKGIAADARPVRLAGVFDHMQAVA
jgi:chemotaxis response regulator CheB